MMMHRKNMNTTVPQCRDNHLTDEITSRDLMGNTRGRCLGCSHCGKYIIYTKEKYYGSVGDGSGDCVYPDCNTQLMNCSRCTCPAEQHEIDECANERELGNDAVALQQYDLAIVHYTNALAINSVDWRLWSNRSKCYAQKMWYSQALADAEKACSLNAEWYKVWYRKAIALKGLRRYKEALVSIQTCMQRLSEASDPQVGDSVAIEALVKELQRLANTGGTSSASKKDYRKHSKVEISNLNSERKIQVKYPNNNTNDGNELNGIKAQIQKLQATLDIVQSMLTKSLSLQENRWRELHNRLDRMESAMHKSFVEVQSEHGDEDRIDEYFSDSDASSTDSSMSGSSTFSETIEMIEEAWRNKLEESQAYQQEDGSCDAGTEHHEDDLGVHHEVDTSCDAGTEGSEVDVGTHHEVDHSSAASTCSRRLSQEDIERQERVANARRRKAEAEASGEPLSQTDLDVLTQKKRTSCNNCDQSCPGFKIYYQPTDVHNPEIMFYCSECGCPSEQHCIDLAWQQEETRKKKKEEEDSRYRAAKMRFRNGLRSEVLTQRQRAFVTLGLVEGCTKTQIRAAYKKLAKQYHPDKQGGLQQDEIMERQQLFTKATDSYKLLMKDFE